MSIVEALVGMSIILISCFAMMTIMQSQNRELKSLSERLIVRDTETYLQRVFSNGPVCSCYFQGKTFDFTSKTWSGGVAREIQTTFAPPPAAPCTPSGDLYLKAGEKIGTSNVYVYDIGVEDMNTSGPGVLSGNLVVKFDATKVVRPIKDIKTSLVIKVDQATGAFQSCVASTLVTTPPPTCVIRTDRGRAPTYVSHARCQAGEYAMSGGGSCSHGVDMKCHPADLPNPNVGFIHFNEMDADQLGWQVDCFKATLPAGDVCSEAWVLCCK